MAIPVLIHPDQSSDLILVTVDPRQMWDVEKEEFSDEQAVDEQDRPLYEYSVVMGYEQYGREGYEVVKVECHGDNPEKLLGQKVDMPGLSMRTYLSKKGRLVSSFSAADVVRARGRSSSTPGQVQKDS